MQIIKKTPAIRPKGKRGDFPQALQRPPRPTALQVLNYGEWGGLNKITGHSTNSRVNLKILP